MEKIFASPVLHSFLEVETSTAVKLLQYFEDIGALLSHLKVANYLLSFYTFLTLIFSTALPFFATEEISNYVFTPVDRLYFWLTFFPEIPSFTEYRGSILCCMYVFIFIMLSLLPHIFSNTMYFSAFRFLEIINLYYVIPATFVPMINCLGKFMSDISPGTVTSDKTLMFFIIIGFIIVLSFSFYIPSTLIRRIDHIFICKKAGQCRILELYFLTNQLLSTNDKYFATIARSIISIALLIYLTIYPCYHSRFLYIMIMITVGFTVSATITLLIVPSCKYIGLLGIVPAILYSLFSTFVFRHFIHKFYKDEFVKADNLYFCGKYDEARDIIQNARKFRIYTKKQLQTGIMLSTILCPDRNDEFIIALASTQGLNLKDRIIIWNSITITFQSRNSIHPAYEQKYFRIQKSLLEQENEFWYRVWCSDSFSITKVAAALGRDKKKLYTNLVIDTIECPHILKSNVIDDHMKKYVLSHISKSLLRKFFRQVSCFDVLFFIGLFITFAQQLYLHIYCQKYQYVFKSFITFQIFTSNFIQFQFDLYDHKINLTQYYMMNESYYAFIGLSDQKMFIENLTLLEEFTVQFSVMLNEIFVQPNNYTIEMFNFMGQYETMLHSTSIHVRIPLLYRYIIDSIITIYLILYIIFSAILIYIEWKKQLKYVDSFMALPKSSILKIGSFDTKNQQIGHETMKPKIYRSINMTILNYFTELLIVVLYMVHSFMIERSIKTDINDLAIPINALSSFSQIPLWFSYSVLQYANNDPHYLDSLRYLDEINDYLCHRKDLTEYQFIIPDEFYSMIFPLYTNGVYEIQRAKDVLINISYNIFDKAQEFKGTSREITAKFISFYIFDILILVISMYVLYYIKSIMTWEQSELKFLYKKYSKYLKNHKTLPEFVKLHSNKIYYDDEMIKLQVTSKIHSGYVKKQQSFNKLICDSIESLLVETEENVRENNASLIENYINELDLITIEEKEETKIAKITQSVLEQVPLTFIVVKRDMRILYVTKAAYEELGAVPKALLTDLPIDTCIISEIISVIHKYTQAATFEPSCVPYSDNLSFVIIPHYGHDLTLSTIVATLIRDTYAELNNINKKINQLFHQIYPRFISVNEQFPMILQPVLKTFLIIYIKIRGFNEWADETDVNIVQEFLYQRSKIVEECESDYFCWISGTSDQMVFALDRKQIKVSIWKILDHATEFANNLLFQLSLLIDNFKAKLLPSAILYKCKEPVWYCGSGNTVCTDVISNAPLVSAELESLTSISTVKYSTERKEMKVPNTTLLKSVYTSKGVLYDIFVIV